MASDATRIWFERVDTVVGGCIGATLLNIFFCSARAGARRDARGIMLMMFPKSVEVHGSSKGPGEPARKLLRVR